MIRRPSPPDPATQRPSCGCCSASATGSATTSGSPRTATTGCSTTSEALPLARLRGSYPSGLPVLVHGTHGCGRAPLGAHRQRVGHLIEVDDHRVTVADLA